MCHALVSAAVELDVFGTDVYACLHHTASLVSA